MTTLCMLGALIIGGHEIDYENVVYNVQKEIVEEKEREDKSNVVQQVSDQSDSEWITVESTAYTAFCDTGCTGTTATGHDVSHSIYYEGMRIIAVDPNVIPLYSIVEIDTGNRLITAIALDTGGDIQGYRIDYLVETKDEAFSWGRRDVKVRIVD